MSKSLKTKLDELRSLLGPKGASMSYAELFDAMSDLSLAAVKAKKFGKKRSQVDSKKADQKDATPARSHSTSKADPARSHSMPKGSVIRSARYIPARLKHEVWHRDRGCCTNCGSRKNLNYDHIRPVAAGGLTIPANLRLLCFGCNQRASIKIFGVPKIRPRR